jgi:GH24 family phage-related lysozyme (muramidase)
MTIEARKRMTTATRMLASAIVVTAFACGKESQPRKLTDSAAAVETSARRASGPKRMSEAGLAQIRQHEAFMPKKYDDGAGNATIGYGHMVLKGEDYAAGITEAEAIELFKKDVERVVNPSLDKIEVELTQNQIDALGSFIFNVGPGAFEKGPLRHINARQHEQATGRMLKYVTGRNARSGERRVLSGLLKRRRSEVALYKNPRPLKFLGRQVSHLGAWIFPRTV